MLGGFFSDPLPAGTPAPEIDAKDENGNRVELSAFRGRPVILLFYPGDDTPTCTQQLCELRDNWGALKRSDAAVFGVNPRGTESHQKFVSKFSFPFPLIVDAGGRVASDYRCGGLVVRRTVYVIGRDGRIAWSVRGRPAVEEILAAVRNS